MAELPPNALPQPFYKYMPQPNALSGTVNISGVNAAANPNAVYLKESKWAYMGTQKDPKTGKMQDTFMDVAGADVSYYFLSNAAKEQLNKQMDALYGKGVWEPSWVNKAYSRGLQASAYAYANMGKRVTALDATMQFLAEDAAAGVNKKSGSGGVAGPSTTMAVTESVSLTDPMSARKMVDTALENYLGRRATAKEAAAFYSALGKAEEKSPTVTTQVSTTTPGGGVTKVRSKTRSEGGFNANVFAEDFARGQEGSAEYQAATTYLDSFIGSLEGIV